MLLLVLQPELHDLRELRVGAGDCEQRSHAGVDVRAIGDDLVERRP